MKKLIIAGIWLVVLIPLCIIIRTVIVPKQKQQAETEKRQQSDQTISKTAAQVHYKHKLKIRLDGFSGYYVLRSQEFATLMARDGILVECYDDGGNYPDRYNALQNGDVDAAAITIDAYLQSAADYAAKNPDATTDVKLPATMVAIIDETMGADALVGDKKKFPTIDSLNNPNVKFVLTRNSPSETLARVVFNAFNLDKVDKQNCFVGTDSSAKVYEIAKNSDRNVNQVYGVWQPDLSKILQDPTKGVIVGSDRFLGYIVDGFFLSRKFVIENRDVAKKTVANYLRVLYGFRNDLVQAIKTDALSGRGETLTDKQAQETVKGIWWKNTTENMAHMGVVSGKNVQPVEGMIRQITDMLRKTDAISVDPTDGQPNLIYYPDILAELNSEGFHPAVDGKEEVREAVKLPVLSDSQWSKLEKIGTLKVDELIFPRGSSELSDDAKGSLDGLAETLKAWPTYYVSILGNSANDPELALERAKVTADYLYGKRIEKSRCRAMAGNQNGVTRVSFVLGQQPY